MCKHSDASNAYVAPMSSAVFIISFHNDSQQLSYFTCFADAYVITMATYIDIRNVPNKMFKTD